MVSGDRSVRRRRADRHRLIPAREGSGPASTRPSRWGPMPNARRWSECRVDGSGNAVGAKERTYTLPGARTSNILVVQPRTEESTLVLQLHVKQYLSSNRGAPPGRDLAPLCFRLLALGRMPPEPQKPAISPFARGAVVTVTQRTGISRPDTVTLLAGLRRSSRRRHCSRRSRRPSGGSAERHP